MRDSASPEELEQSGELRMPHGHPSPYQTGAGMVRTLQRGSRKALPGTEPCPFCVLAPAKLDEPGSSLSPLLCQLLPTATTPSEHRQVQIHISQRTCNVLSPTNAKRNHLGYNPFPLYPKILLQEALKCESLSARAPKI